MNGSLVPFPCAKLSYVVDTWPVMEWLKNRQPQAERFRGLIERATRQEIGLHMSVVNLGEVYYNAAKEWGVPQAEEILLRMRELPIVLVSVADEDVLAAARLKAVHTVSYADAFAAGLAIRLGCPLLTGDGDFHALVQRDALKVEWVGA